MKPNTCSLCGGILREGKTELVIKLEDQAVVIKNLPAYVCEDCGEAYFTPDTSRKIDKIMKEFYEDKISKRPITAFEIEL